MQKTALFSLPAVWATAHPMDASDWRSRWVAAGIGSTDHWNRLRVVAVRDMLWIIAGTPAGGQWLADHLDGIAGVVAQTVDDAVPLVVRDRHVGVRPGGEDLWAYRFPRVVVAKGGGDWKPHFEPTLPRDIIDRMTRSIEAGLRRELNAWDRLPPILDNQQPFLAIAHPGRAVIIPAIHGDRSGHGKPVNVLVRSQLVVLSPFKFEGELFAGPLASIGYGRMLRTTPPDMLDRDTQRALLTLPQLTEDASL